MNAEVVLKKLKELLLLKRPEFHHGTIKFIAGSSVNSSIQFYQELFDENNIPLEMILNDFDQVSDSAKEMILEINEKNRFNVIEFSFTTPLDYTYKWYWEQSIQDKFDNNLPKSMQGKVIPWYSPESDYSKKTTIQIQEKKVTAHRWQPIGELIKEFEIQYLSPIHHNYPQWAGDRYLQLWHTHWNTYMVCTQGLYEQGEETSLELELYLETVEKPDNFGNSWQENIVYELGKLLPKVSDLKQRFETYKYISVQIAMDGAPEEWSLPEHDNIGVLLGIEHEEFQKRNIKFPFRPLNCKLLRPAETKMIKRLNVQGREKLVSFFRQKGNATISSLSRPSAVKDE